MLYNILSRIELLIETKKYDKAQNLVNQNLADYPDTPELYALSARIALSQSDDKRAVESINIAIGLNPNIAELFYLKAVALSHLKKHKEALIEINRAIELQPEYSVFYGQKAFILLRQELKEEAIRWARHGKSINANDDVCTNVLSMALGSSGQIEESKEVLGKLLQDDPENEFTHSNMGYNFLREGNIVKAKEHFQSALIINPESIYAKSGMMEAIKGTNFFYRKILQYQSWMEKKSSKNQWV